MSRLSFLFTRTRIVVFSFGDDLLDWKETNWVRKSRDYAGEIPRVFSQCRFPERQYHS
jgi:hypothetical protein